MVTQSITFICKVSDIGHEIMRWFPRGRASWGSNYYTQVSVSFNAGGMHVGGRLCLLVHLFKHFAAR